MLTGQIRTPNPWTIEITNKFNHPKKSRKLLPSWGGDEFLASIYSKIFSPMFPDQIFPNLLRRLDDLELWESLSTVWKKHHVVDDKLGQHCIASKVFYDVFLEVHNSMHAACSCFHFHLPRYWNSGFCLPYLPARDATYEAELFGLSTEAWESSIERSGVRSISRSGGDMHRKTFQRQMENRRFCAQNISPNL